MTAGAGSPTLDERLPDGGPRYLETPAVIERDGLHVAEPYNAASASLFVVIALYYLVLRRAAVRRDRFLAMAVPVLLVGGIGGALYHGLRTQALFFWLDVGPIFLLALAFSVRLWLDLQLGRRGLALVVGGFIAAQALVFAVLSTHAAVNVSYALMATFIVVPLGLALARSRGRGGAWVAVALASFAVALFFRHLESTGGTAALPMGSHWLWHLFGAGATVGMAEYQAKTPCTNQLPLPS